MVVPRSLLAFLSSGQRHRSLAHQFRSSATSGSGSNDSGTDLSGRRTGVDHGPKQAMTNMIMDSGNPHDLPLTDSTRMAYRCRKPAYQ
jgi:hypothetical protein